MSAEAWQWWLIAPILAAACLGAAYWLKYGERRNPSPADDDNDPDTYCA